MKITRDHPALMIEVIAREEFVPVRGNCLASGDDATDKAAEDAILARLEDGDTWAWASVEVKVSFRDLSASDHLGCCSYRDEGDFRESGYFDDMVDEALARLNDKLADLLAALEVTS
jgi:hypothetical protein